MRWYYFTKYQTDYYLSAFSNEECRFTILFELLPVLLGGVGGGGGNSDAASVKSTELVSVIEASRT